MIAVACPYTLSSTSTTMSCHLIKVSLTGIPSCTLNNKMLKFHVDLTCVIKRNWLTCDQKKLVDIISQLSLPLVKLFVYVSDYTQNMDRKDWSSSQLFRIFKVINLVLSCSFIDYADERYDPRMAPQITSDKWRKGSQVCFSTGFSLNRTVSAVEV